MKHEMRYQYFIHVLDVPRQARKLWGTEVDDAPDASQRVAALLRRHHIETCLVVEVAATADGHVGFGDERVEHRRAVSSVYAGWFVVDMGIMRARRITSPSDVDRFDLQTVFLQQEPDMKAAIDYGLAVKRQALNARFGRSSGLPPRPALVDLLESGRPGASLGAVVRLLAEQGGVAFCRMSASRKTVVTWTQEPADVWLARWRAAAVQPHDVTVVEDLPVD